MEKIILLKGTLNVGKTLTLNIVIDLLQLISSSYEIKKESDWSEDRIATFVFKGKTICVYTAGDTRRIVNSYFKYFDEQDCDIAVCSTHLKDESKKAFDKKTENMEIDIDEFRKKNEKDLDYAEQLIVARETAAEIFKRILKFCYDK